MKRRTHMAAALGMAAATVFSFFSFDPSIACGQSGPRIHLVIVADTNDPKIGTSVKADVANVRGLFEANVPQSQLSVAVVSGVRARPEAALRTIKRLPVRADRDTVVVYYSGHGGFEERSTDHVLAPGQRPLRVKEVKSAVQEMRPRFGVIIADCCSTVITSPLITGAAPPSERITEAFRSLFLVPTGLMFVCSTKPGEEAMGDDNGGYFTCSFVYYLAGKQEETLTWDGVLSDVNDQVSEMHQGDARQTAYIASRIAGNGSPAPGPNVGSPPPGRIVGSAAPGAVGGGPTSRHIPFGITATRTAKSEAVGGVEVIQVERDSPATRIRDRQGHVYRLVPGADIITHVNGAPVTTNAEVVAAVKRSPVHMVVRVRDSRTGKVADYDVLLEDEASTGP